MKTFLLPSYVFLLFLIPSLAFAQGWERKYGSGIDHKGYYAYPTSDGGYILGASSTKTVITIKSSELTAADELLLNLFHATGRYFL